MRTLDPIQFRVLDYGSQGRRDGVPRYGRTSAARPCGIWRIAYDQCAKSMSAPKFSSNGIDVAFEAALRLELGPTGDYAGSSR